jgi:cyclic dehypoxanthinyl futalosine synthase
MTGRGWLNSGGCSKVTPQLATDPVSRVLDGRRLSREEGLHFLRDAELLELGSLAHTIRMRKHPELAVTFVIDTNPNYTNVCTTDCQFCAFYRKPGHSEGYTHSIEELIGIVGNAVRQGATTLLLQGGHNPEIPYAYYLDLVSALKEAYPELYLHLWSASEIWQMAETAGKTVSGVLQDLYERGQKSLPGGGAEILSDRVKKRISPKKINTAQWLDVHREAHRIGMKSTATMMYGHVETDEEIIEHLDLIRDLQDEYGGFTAFVPWSFKPGNTLLMPKTTAVAGPTRYLRILATSRLFLDNFPHIQASWFSEGKKTGQVALHFGADDFGGTLIEERVLKAADHHNRTTTDETIDIIRESGFSPVQRTTLYDIVRRY